MLTAATVYMKFKYPLQYYIALLKMARHESDSHEIIDVINKELQQFNIKLLPPDLIKSQMDFSIEDGNIRYGLNCIKGVSEKSLESILKFRKKEANNKFDIFIAAKESKINIGILCALIQAGALNSINDDRAYMVHEAQVFNILTDREKRNWINFGEKHNYDVFKIWNNEVKGANIADDGKILVSEKREQTIKNKCEKFVEIYKMNSKNKDFANWYFEKQLLGYSYDKRLKDVYTNNKFIVGIEKVLEGETKEQFLTIGTIKDIYNGKTKNGDKKYCRLTVVDEVAEITCFIWEEKLLDLQNAGILLEKGSIVSLNLSKMGGDAASVNQVSNITDSIYMKLSDLK
jgi:DNA polymerase III alpha subunit